MRKTTAPNVPISPTPLPTIDLAREITSPDLRNDAGIEFALADLQRQGQKDRERLIAGKDVIIEDERTRGALGRLMGHALARGDTDTAQSIGLFWINQSKDLKDPLADMIDVLQDQGRADLVRPGVFLLNKLCRALWAYRIEHAPRAVSDFSAADFPDLMSVSPQQYECIVYPEVIDDPWKKVAWAWWRLGEKLTQMSGTWNTPSKAKHLGLIVSDITRTIPDTRAWAAGVFLTSIQVFDGAARHWSPWDTPEWVDMLKQLITCLAKHEAPLVLGRVADALIATRNVGAPENVQNSLEQMAHRLIESHPSLSLEEWLSTTPHMEKRLPSYRKGTGSVRSFIMNHGNVAVTPAETLYAAAAETYNILLGWLCPQRANEMSAEQRESLREVMDKRKVQPMPLAALRSALDFWDLSQVGNSNQRGVLVDKQPGGLSGKPPDDGAPAASRKRRI